MNRRRKDKGQGLVEFAIILPILILLLIGLAEMGFLLRDYLVVVSSNREAARFAARGQFTPAEVIERAVSAGGVVRAGGADKPFLKTQGPEANTGVILTYIPMDVNGDVEYVRITRHVSGVNSTGAITAPIDAEDSRISLTLIIDRQGPVTQQISDMRAAQDYERKENYMVAVEVFFRHEPIFGNTLHNITFGIVPEAPWPIRTETLMRVVSSRGGSGSIPGFETEE